MKKNYTVFLLVLILMLSLTTTAFGSIKTLWKVTSNTYVSSEHGDNFFADTYYGIAAVRGTDRSLNSSYRNVYYKWTKITYDVQGDIYSTTAYSANKNDSTKVVENITVKDKWNFGPQTKVYYNYAAIIADGNTGRSINSTEVIYGGGLLEEGVILQERVAVEEN